MATGWWVGADNGNWSTLANWRTTVSGTTAVGSVPGINDLAYFTHNNVTTSRNVYLTANRSVGGIVLNTNVGTGDIITIRGGTAAVPATNTLTLGGSVLDLAGGGGGSIVFHSTCNLNFNGSATSFSVAGGGSAEIYGGVSNCPSFSISGAGVAIFGGSANTAAYSISNGSTRIASTTGFGTGLVTFTGGTLGSNDGTGYSIINDFNVSGSVTFYDATRTGFIATSGTFRPTAPTTLTFGAAQQLYISGAFNSSNASATLTLAGAAGTLRLVGPLGTFNSAISIGTGITIQLAEFTSGTPNQLNNASLVTLQPGSRLTFYGNTSSSINCSINFGGAGGGYLTVVNPQTLTFQGTTFTNNGPFEVSAESSNGLTQTQRVIFTLASQVGTPQYYGFYSTNGVTYTSLTQIIEYTGSAAATNGKIIYIDHGSNNGGTFILRNNSGNGSTFNQTASIRHNKNTIAEALTIDAVGGPMVFSSAGTLTEAATGVLAVTKTGTYAVTLSGANNFRGAFTLSQGPLTANNATALGAAASTTDVSVASTTTLTLSTAATYTSRTLKVLGGAVVIGHAGTTTTFLAITANTAASSFRGTSSGSLAATNGIACGTFRPTLSASAGNSITVTAAVTGSGGLLVGTSTDTGKVTLSAANAGLSGTTTLAYGTLQTTNISALGVTGVTQSASTVLQTPQSNGRLNISGAYANNGGTIRIGGA